MSTLLKSCLKRIHIGKSQLVKMNLELPKERSVMVSSDFMENDDSKWLKLKCVNWRDRAGVERKWEMCQRTNRCGSIDAVSVLPLLDYGAKAIGKQSTVFVSQFRPPIGHYCLEMVAGLVDGDESTTSAALRELREETGLVGDCKSVNISPIGVNDPGLTDANMQLVTVRVDMTLPENKNAKQQLDEGEDIALHTVELDSLLTSLQQFEKQGFAIDARLLHFATGLEFSKKWQLQ